MDSIFLDGSGVPLNLNDTVIWYSKRFRTWVSGPITQLRASLDFYKKPVIKITVHATYPRKVFPTSYVVIKPSSVIKKGNLII